MMQIVVGGDVCPIRGVELQFARGDAGAIFNDLLDPIQTADLSIVNLECPLISTPSPIRKVGKVLGAGKECIAGFAAAGWRVLNLANNHSFDHGAPGLRETIATATHAGLHVVGAGMDLEKAQTPFVTEIDGRRVVIYAMAEREFSAADANTAGANPLDLINFVHAVQTLKEDGLFVVLLHGGVEYYPYPPPQMVRRCRFMVDMGADAVICSHTHCALPWEVYRGRPIAYGMGNLAFLPPEPTSAEWYQGYLVRLTVEKTEIRFEAIPYSQYWGHTGARKLAGDAEKRFLAEMQQKQAGLQDAAILEQQWLDYCRQQSDTYLPQLFGYNRLMRKYRRFLLRALHSKQQLLGALNMVQCDSQREMIAGILKDRSNQPSAGPG